MLDAMIAALPQPAVPGADPAVQPASPGVPGFAATLAAALAARAGPDAAGQASPHMDAQPPGAIAGAVALPPPAPGLPDAAAPRKPPALLAEAAPPASALGLREPGAPVPEPASLPAGPHAPIGKANHAPEQTPIPLVAEPDRAPEEVVHTMAGPPTEADLPGRPMPGRDTPSDAVPPPEAHAAPPPAAAAVAVAEAPARPHAAIVAGSAEADRGRLGTSAAQLERHAATMQAGPAAPAGPSPAPGPPPPAGPLAAVSEAPAPAARRDSLFPEGPPPGVPMLAPEAVGLPALAAESAMPQEAEPRVTTPPVPTFVAAPSETGPDRPATPAMPEAARPATPPQAMPPRDSPGFSFATDPARQGFDLRLDMPGLGAVEVEVRQADGAAEVVVRSDRADTLVALARDGADLDRALRDAGIGPEGRSMSFLLAQGDGQEGQRQRGPGSRLAPPEPLPVPGGAAPHGARHSLLDIHV